MRTDPTDTGGLFVGRRPGTAPIRFRAPLRRRGILRQRLDGSLASGLLALIVAGSLLCWGPIPVLCLWVGAQLAYVTASVSFGMAVALIAMLALLLCGLAVLRRLDHAWLLVRRAAGHEQRAGALGRVFAFTAAVSASAFTIWFMVVHGPGVTADHGPGPIPVPPPGAGKP